MVRGSSPQSWRASYLCSPSPSMGGLTPALSVAPRKIGAADAAAAVTTKLRRVIFIVERFSVGGVILPVWGGHSCPPPLTLILTLKSPAVLNQSQNQKRRTRVSAPHWAVPTWWGKLETTPYISPFISAPPLPLQPPGWDRQIAARSPSSL